MKRFEILVKTDNKFDEETLYNILGEMFELFDIEYVKEIRNDTKLKSGYIE